MNEYKEAKTNIVNTLVRIVGYPTLKKQFERDLEVLGELVEKATPKKPKLIKDSFDDYYVCSNCGKILLDYRKYCHTCGQALDWRKEDE